MQCNMFPEKECHVPCRSMWGRTPLEYCRECIFDMIDKVIKKKPKKKNHLK